MPHEIRRTARRGDRGPRRHRDAPPAGRRGAEGLGHVAPLRRLGRPRGDRQPRLRRAPLARVERLGRWATTRRARWCWRRSRGAGASAPTGLPRAIAGDPHAPEPLTAGGDRADRRRRPRRRARPRPRRRPRMAGAALRSASSATTGWRRARRWRSARRSTCASTG